MKIYRIAVGMLETNCYIVASRRGRALIIDPGDEASKIEDVLKNNRLVPEVIINTHGHFDHVKADAALKLPVAIHEDDAGMISDPEKNVTAAFFGTFDPVKPARLLKDADTIMLDDVELKVIHTPGHTPGGICLSSDGVLFSGDTLFRDGIGRTDFPGASPAAMEESLKKLARLPGDLVVYPGHGPETTIARELHG